MIRNCDGTLYVWLQHAVPPTNTKFKPLLLQILAGICDTNTKSTEHRISSLHSYFCVQLSTGSPDQQ